MRLWFDKLTMTVVCRHVHPQPEPLMFAAPTGNGAAFRRRHVPDFAKLARHHRRQRSRLGRRDVPDFAKLARQNRGNGAALGGVTCRILPSLRGKIEQEFDRSEPKRECRELVSETPDFLRQGA